MMHRNADRTNRRRRQQLRCLSNILERARGAARLGSPIRLQGRQMRSASLTERQLADAFRDTLEGPVKDANSVEGQVASIPLSASLYGDYSFIYDLYLE